MRRLIVALGALLANTAAAVTVSIDPATQTLALGGSANVSVRVDDSSTINAYDLGLSYDISIVSVGTVLIGSDASSAGCLFSANTLVAGKICIAIACVTPINVPNAELAVVSFNGDNIGVSPVEFDASGCSPPVSGGCVLEDSGGPVSCSTEDGSITVAAATPTQTPNSCCEDTEGNCAQLTESLCDSVGGTFFPNALCNAEGGVGPGNCVTLTPTPTQTPTPTPVATTSCCDCPGGCDYADAGTRCPDTACTVYPVSSHICLPEGPCVTPTPTPSGEGCCQVEDNCCSSNDGPITESDCLLLGGTWYPGAVPCVSTNPCEEGGVGSCQVPTATPTPTPTEAATPAASPISGCCDDCNDCDDCQ